MNPNFQPTQPPQQPGIRPALKRQRVSKMAIIALVLAVIPMCPPVSLAGVVVGLAALRRIAAAGGTLSGRRIAQWAMVIGILLTIGSTILLSTVTRFVDQTNREIMTSQILESVNAAPDGQVERARQLWETSPGRGPTAEQLGAFSSAATGRYGTLQRFSIVRMTASGSFFQQQYVVAGVYVFERSERTGSATFEVAATANGVWPEFRLISLVIEDTGKGDLRMPEPATP